MHVRRSQTEEEIGIEDVIPRSRDRVNSTELKSRPRLSRRMGLQSNLVALPHAYRMRSEDHAVDKILFCSRVQAYNIFERKVDSSARQASGRAIVERISLGMKNISDDLLR